MSPVLHSVLIDIDGVLCIGPTPIAGATQALQCLRDGGAGLRFVTNTTRRTREQIVQQLQQGGFDIADHEVITGALAARRLLVEHGWRPHLLVHPGLLPDFEGLDTAEPNAVVIGDAGDGFSYAAMNQAFHVLIAQPDAPLIALANNRYFRSAEGLALDAGPFVAALEYATGRQALVTGKPAAALFQAALDDLGSTPAQAAMVGDDVEADVGGAQALGLTGILVRTGKYRAGDERDRGVRPDAVADDFVQAVQDLLLPRLAR